MNIYPPAKKIMNKKQYWPSACEKRVKAAV